MRAFRWTSGFPTALGARAALAVAIVVAALGLTGQAATAAGPATGKAAPAFTGKTASGETIRLSQFEGKPVILEWTNHQCPYVQKHYGTGNMQALQKDLTADGVVWIAVISSAPGRQGHVSPNKALQLMEKRDADPTHVVLDPSGEIGRKYGARTTPHMYLIDSKGELVFKGGIDDKPSTDWDTVETATNYVRAAYRDLKAGEPIEKAATRPYGCSIKYGS